MAGSVKRERQLARERYERQQARRRAAAARRRRLQQGGAVVFAVLLVVAGVVALALSLGGDDKSTVATKGPSTSSTKASSTAAEPSPSDTPAGVDTASCTYAEASEAAAKDVGVPTYKQKRDTKPFTATLVTDRGDITVEMAADKAPCTTTSFRYLAENRYFDGTPCHRLTTDNIFVLQCGDPTGTGGGGPGYQFGVENAPADGVYPAGTVAMARTSDPGTNGSQFFLVYEETRLPDANGYSVFGTVTKGLDLVQAVADKGVEGGGGDGKPAQPVTIERVRIGKA